MIMEDGALPQETTLSTAPDSSMDLDFMDELFLGGCWLETTDGSEYLLPSPSNSGSIFDPSYLWASFGSSNADVSANSPANNIQEERQGSNFPGNAAEIIDKTQSLSQSVTNGAGYPVQSENNSMDDFDPSRRWWIRPKSNPGPSSPVMERLVRALSYLRSSTKNKDALIQIWVPVNKGGRQVLTTTGQPFSLDPSCPGLAKYRDISVSYQFSAEKDSKELTGLPGRVYLAKAPEWTPDVRFFRSEEYLRVDYAHHFDVRGTLALPVFEQGSQTCLGVIEVVMTTQKSDYRPELESVCKALEAVDLRSSEILNTQNVKACIGFYQAALPEILEVLTSACGTHGLPLAQTWVQCMQQGKRGPRHTNENYVNCVSTVDSACCVADPDIQGFHEACSEHHLLKGQGVAGRAFLTNEPCFSADVTSFSKTQYPLSHHARMFRLCAAVAIRLRSVLVPSSDFVLEFFLPADCRDPEEQRRMLFSLSIIIQKVCRSLRVVTDNEFQEETASLGKLTVFSDGTPTREETEKLQHTPTEKRSQEQSSLTACPKEAQQSIDINLTSHNEKVRERLSEKSLEFRQHQRDSNLHGSFDCRDDSTFCKSSLSSVGKTGERRRSRAEQTITLQVLQQYFAGSLKDAAKSIGVCPTTLKRICRQHGIKRWPSRKIKKVGHSLHKIQLVIDSVKGASGAFQIGNFYSKFPELASPKLSGTRPYSNSKFSDHQKPSSMPPPEEDNCSPGVAVSKSLSSSCSQSSSSSQCCSTGTQQQPSTWNGSGNDPMVGENTVEGLLKRVRSEVELPVSSQVEMKPLPRSQSLKSLPECPNFDTYPPIQQGGAQASQEGGDAWRVKVAYGDEKIRFRMQSNWGLRDLRQELGRRFNIEESSGFHLKYLDDDLEWVLLTCEADFEECKEVCESSQNHVIRLVVHQISHHLGSSLGSSCP